MAHPIAAQIVAQGVSSRDKGGVPNNLGAAKSDGSVSAQSDCSAGSQRRGMTSLSIPTAGGKVVTIHVKDMGKQRFGVCLDRNCIVTNILPGGLANLSGVKVGDRLTNIGDVAVTEGKGQADKLLVSTLGDCEIALVRDEDNLYSHRPKSEGQRPRSPEDISTIFEDSASSAALPVSSRPNSGQSSPKSTMQLGEFTVSTTRRDVDDMPMVLHQVL